MGLFDGLFDKREKKNYGDILLFFFNIAQMQRVQYPEQYADIKEQEYRETIVGIFAAYLDTKEKQKCVITSYGWDLFVSQVGCVSREVKEKVLPKYEDAYKYYRNIIQKNMSNTINATNVNVLASEVCRTFGVEPDIAKINTISMDICTMRDIIDATFDTYRFI